MVKIGKIPSKNGGNQISRGPEWPHNGRSADWWSGREPYKLQFKYHRLRQKLGLLAQRATPPPQKKMFFWGGRVEFSIVDNSTFDLVWRGIFFALPPPKKISIDFWVLDVLDVSAASMHLIWVQIPPKCKKMHYHNIMQKFGW